MFTYIIFYKLDLYKNTSKFASTHPTHIEINIYSIRVLKTC